VTSKNQRAITRDFPVISGITPQKSLARWSSFQTLLEEPQRFKQAAKKGKSQSIPLKVQYALG
jgi:hypothetical protein